MNVLASLSMKTDFLTIIFTIFKNRGVSISATNHSNQVIEPQLYNTDVFLNGEWSFRWMLTIGNGIRPRTWQHLPPKETISLTCIGTGEIMFREPGEYTVQLKYHNVKSEIIKVMIDELGDN